MEDCLSTSYNLRRSQRRRSLSENCYLRKLPKNRSPAIIQKNPKVQLERLKVLECANPTNVRFSVVNGRIVKHQLSGRSSKKSTIKFVCTVILLITSMIYWKDDLERGGLQSLRQIKAVHNAVKKIFFDTVELSKTSVNEFIRLNSSKNDSINNLNLSKLHTEALNYTEPNENIDIGKLVRDHIVELKKKNKYRKKSGRSFIEEQCGREMGSNLADHFQIPVSEAPSSDYLTAENLTDYALESQGARIISVFDTELYGTFTMKFFNFNFNFGSQVNNFLLKHFTSSGPSSVLVPWKKAGDCWAFKGSNGKVQIQLSERIFITAVAIDHISMDKSPNGNIKSAPKEFFLVGIDDEDEKSPRTFMGEYEYKITKPPLQIFPVEVKTKKPFRNVEFVIKSNHGNNLYTCIYKIRVHGYK